MIILKNDIIRIDKTQQNSKYRLCGDRKETISYIIKEYRKLAQKEHIIIHNCQVKEIHGELCNKLYHTIKWYMHNPEFVPKNVTYKILKDFEIQMVIAIRNDTDNMIDDRMTTTKKQKLEKKQLYGGFKWLINNISRQKTWTWLRKGNLMKETECLQIAAQDNAIRTNHIKASIDKTQQNSKCRLYSDRDEMINHIISECSKLTQKEYKARHDWVSKVIHWEMCKKFKFYHTNKWYLHNPAPVLENDAHELQRAFNIETDQLNPSRKPDLKFAKLSTLLSRQTTE